MEGVICVTRRHPGTVETGLSWETFPQSLSPILQCVVGIQAFGWFIAAGSSFGVDNGRAGSSQSETIPCLSLSNWYAACG